MTIYKDAKGFTLIEAIAVLIVLGILSAVVMSRVTSTADASIKAQAEALKGHMRYAQMRALNSDAPDCNASVGLIMSGGSYSMFSVTGSSGCTGTTNVILPGAESSSGVTLPAGMTVTATAFSFDRWGRPCSDLLGITLAPDIDLTLDYEGRTEHVRITKNTGFVQ